MDIVKELITSLQDTDVVEFSITKKNCKVSFRKDLRSIHVTAPASVDGSLQSSENAEPEQKLAEITSPMVGTFYAASSPNRPPLVIEGDHVIPGQKLGMIEAMKVMKDVMSAVQGRVVKVLLVNGTPVEYGQPLFLIDTFSPESGREE